MRFEELFATLKAKLFAADAFGFRKAIGVKHVAIAKLQRKLHGFVDRLGKHAQEQAILFDGACAAVRTIAVQERRVSGAGIAKNLAIEVDENVSRRYKVILEFSAECLIQSSENAGRVGSVSRLPGERDFEHRSNNRRWYAVAGDVSDENAELIFLGRKEIVEISGNRAHGEIASSDLEASDAGHFARENRGLDLARDFKLFVDRKQTMLICEGAVGRHVAEAADEKQETERFEVRS